MVEITKETKLCLKGELLDAEQVCASFRLTVFLVGR